MSPTRPPAEVESPAAPRAAPRVPAAAAPLRAPDEATLNAAEMRTLVEAAQATAKATREAVDYTRVMPDLLTQILAKLDKIEDKLDRIDTALKGGAPKRR